MVDKTTMALAKASYDRCSKSPEFLQAFYRNFLAACPDAVPHFAKTDFDEQTKLLRHAIGLLLIFPNQPNKEPNLLSRLAERHSRRDLDIPPALYGPFVDALVATVKQFDDKCSPTVESAWRETLAPGVEFMKSKH
ncbi:MAG TPA: globin [Gemmatimonadales bacterium]|nr:globin [Gemmatimonadales bacterium]